MALLNTANKIYVGTQAASAVYAGATKVWPSGAPPWTPAALGTDLVAWLDASDAATVTITGSGVSQWLDKSSYGRHVTQGNDGNRPSYAAGKIGISDVKGLQAVTSYPVAHDLIFAGKSLGAGKYHSLFVTGGGSYLSFVIDPSDLVGIWTDGLHQAVGMTWPPATEAMMYVTLSGALNVTMGKNGASATAINTPLPNTQLYTIGQPAYAQGFGDLYEVVWVPYNSSLDIRQRLEGYLAWKWSLASLLPAGHPYKSAAPT